MARVANVRALVYSLVSMWYSMRIMSIDGLVTKLMGIGFGIFVKRSEANNKNTYEGGAKDRNAPRFATRFVVSRYEAISTTWERCIR